MVTNSLGQVTEQKCDNVFSSSQTMTNVLGKHGTTSIDNMLGVESACSHAFYISESFRMTVSMDGDYCMYVL